MATEELFLRHIDSLDGNIEVIAQQGVPYITVTASPFSWVIENTDRDAVVGLVATVMADPEESFPPIPLTSGEQLHVGAHLHKDGSGRVQQSLLYISSGCVHVRMHFGTASLLMAAVCEARKWHRDQLLRASGEVAAC